MKFFANVSASVLFAVAVLSAASAATAARPATLIVHEWGTFTSCQQANGHALGGINTDDEPVPPFVHDLAPGLIHAFSKGLPAAKQSVTMRLETPVLYFYPSASAPKQLVNVFVRFRGGWLSQFYPDAVAAAPGISVGKKGAVYVGHLTASTVGSLRWTGVRMEQLIYDCRLFNRSLIDGGQLQLRKWMVESDTALDPQAYILSPDSAIRVAKAIVTAPNSYAAGCAAALTAVAVLREGYEAGKLKLPPRELAMLDIIQSSVEELPDTENAFVRLMMSQVDRRKFVEKDYDL